MFRCVRLEWSCGESYMQLSTEVTVDRLFIVCLTLPTVSLVVLIRHYRNLCSLYYRHTTWWYSAKLLLHLLLVRHAICIWWRQKYQLR